MTESRRRQYGTGSLHQRASDGMWVGTIEAGWTERGTRRRVTVSSRDKAEARRKLRDKQAQLKREGDTGVGARMTVKAWAETWLPMTERTLAPKAYGSNASAVKRWIIPTIGHKRLELLTPGDVRAVAEAQRAAGRAGSTQLRTHSVLMSMVKAAMAEGHHVPPRLLVVKPPIRGTSDRVDMAVEEATAVLVQAATLPHGSRYVAALLQGIRQAEALGLTWECVDFERGLMRIEWQLQALPYKVKRDKTSGFRIPDGYECRQLNGAMHLVRPKSKAGWRIIPMVPWMRTALLTWREIAGPSPHGLVWPDPEGAPRYYKTDDAEWYALQKAAGVTHPTRVHKTTGDPMPYTIHETRHTTATLLLEAGVDPAIIVQIIGHSSIITTRGYQHVRTGPALAALDLVAERLQLVAPVDDPMMCEQCGMPKARCETWPERSGEPSCCDGCDHVAQLPGVRGVQ